MNWTFINIVVVLYFILIGLVLIFAWGSQLGWNTKPFGGIMVVIVLGAFAITSIIRLWQIFDDLREED